MPYPGVPGKYTKKVERCVQRVMADGKNKSTAIAICVDSIVPKKELEMTEKYREQKRIREARQNKEAQALADDPLDNGQIKLADTKLPENWKTTDDVVEFLDDITAEEKGIAGVSDYYYYPYGGALSFDELDAYLETQEQIIHMDEVTHQFRAIIENILSNGDVDFSEKTLMIQTAAEVYKMKLTDIEKEKSFVERLKEIFTQKKEMPDSQLSVIVTKDGEHRWFGHYTNNYKDREGEIITEEAHKEFVAYLKANPNRMPSFRIWHIPGTDRKKDADYVEYFDGFMIASGPLTKEEAEQLEKAIAYDNGQTGMSHGMIVLQRDTKNPNLITKYRTFEISDLPLANAANGFTGVNLKEVKMSKEKFDRLVTTIGEEAAKKVVDQIGDNKEVLAELGVESKEEDVAVVEEESAEEVEAEEVEEAEAEEAEAEEPAEEDKQVKELAIKIVKELKLETLAEILAGQKESIEQIQTEIKELKKSDDEKVAEKFEDKSIGAMLWKERKSQSEDTEISEDELNDAEVPGLEEESWVTEAFG